jgi:DnaJ-class molecular chaperone
MGERHIPPALEAGHLCHACKGTGADIARTLNIPDWDAGYVMCHACNGNGLDPSAYFKWSKPSPSA